MEKAVRIIGIDPGLLHTGWGIVDFANGKNHFVGAGVINPNPKAPFEKRLLELHERLRAVITEFKPQEASVEKIFVNVNAVSTLKLVQARAIALLSAAQSDVTVTEYGANQIKKAVTGVGHATKDQIAMMIRVMFPALEKLKADANDALAMAVCHSYMRVTAERMKRLTGEAV